MITNKDLVALGRKLEEERDINERVRLMHRITIIREDIRVSQVTLLQLETELAVANEKWRERSQLRLNLTQSMP